MAAAFDKSENDKNAVRTARNKQLANGTYFDMKTYDKSGDAEKTEEKASLA